MADRTNFLLGRGETLIQAIELQSGGGEKADPYSLGDAFRALKPQLERTSAQLFSLPQEACPNDEAVISVTLHPSYLAKSYHPASLLREAGLRQVGSRERKVAPRVRIGRQKEVEKVVAPELFVAGTRSAIARFADTPLNLLNSAASQYDFRKIEEVRVLSPDRVKIPEDARGMMPLEAVLHAAASNDAGRSILKAFENWLLQFGIGDGLRHRQQVGGLSFLGIRADVELASDLAKFTFLRLIRRMPKLALRDASLRTMELGSFISVPRNLPLPASQHVSVAVFDGGLPAAHPFGAAVNAYDAPGVGHPWEEGLVHGTQVTSALLFGPLEEGVTPPNPFAAVDHWRVLDNQGDDFELMETLDRVMDVLDQHEYDFVNLSIGPDEAMLDDEVHVWTSRLDEYSATGRSLIICAAGNNGEMDSASGLSRVQPSADGVNVLGVGASTCFSDDWQRAQYSAVGPGRSPGLVKPDILAFGGCDDRPYFAISETGKAEGVQGTSFAAPSVARMATGLKAMFGDQLSQFAIKALLIHHAEPQDHSQLDVGWGRLPTSLSSLTDCPDHSSTVVYQGLLEPARYRRFPLPYPDGGFTGRVSIRATFVTATTVDPEDSINYTRTGVGITFRPKTTGHPGFYETADGPRERSVHQSKSFFGSSLMFQTEQELRDDANRWESVVRNQHRFNATTLDAPVFDIEHLTRAHGQAAVRSDAVHYALIVTITEKAGTNLYDRILSTFAGRLRPLQPRIDLRV